MSLSAASAWPQQAHEQMEKPSCPLSFLCTNTLSAWQLMDGESLHIDSGRVPTSLGFQAS